MNKKDMPEFLATKNRVIELFEGIETTPSNYAAKITKKKNA
jgi:hypothetical protein